MCDLSREIFGSRMRRIDHVFPPFSFVVVVGCFACPVQLLWLDRWAIACSIGDLSSDEPVSTGLLPSSQIEISGSESAYLPFVPKSCVSLGIALRRRGGEVQGGDERTRVACIIEKAIGIALLIISLSHSLAARERPIRIRRFPLDAQFHRISCTIFFVRCFYPPVVQ